jgi:hypothetical protein
MKPHAKFEYFLGTWKAHVLNFKVKKVLEIWKKFELGWAHLSTAQNGYDRATQYPVPRSCHFVGDPRDGRTHGRECAAADPCGPSLMRRRQWGSPPPFRSLAHLSLTCLLLCRPTRCATAIPSHRCLSRPKSPSSAPLRPATGSSPSHGPSMQGTPYTEPPSPSTWVTVDHRSPCTSGPTTASRRTTRAHHSSMTRSSPSMTHYPSHRHPSVGCRSIAAVSFPPSSTPNWDPRGLGLVPGY